MGNEVEGTQKNPVSQTGNTDKRDVIQSKQNKKRRCRRTSNPREVCHILFLGLGRFIVALEHIKHEIGILGLLRGGDVGALEQLYPL